MKPAARRVQGRRAVPRQRGVVLFVAIIVLVIMTLAGLALLRQMGIGVSIAGNVAFKENATSVADRGAEVAMQYIVANSAGLALDDFPNGYHSSWEVGVDPTAFDWANRSFTLTGPDFGQTGNTARIIIHRLCAASGVAVSAPTQRCSDSINPNAGGSRGGATYPSASPSAAPQPYFRVTTRVDGPRNTISYTQVLLQ